MEEDPNLPFKEYLIIQLDPIPIDDERQRKTTSVHFNGCNLFTTRHNGMEWWSSTLSYMSIVQEITSEEHGLVKSSGSDDEKTGYVVTTTNTIVRYSMEKGQWWEEWKTPENGSCHGQLFAKSGKVWLADPKGNTIIIYDKTGNDIHLTMQIEKLNWPTFMAYYDDESIIVSGKDAIGRFPVVEKSEPLWMEKIPGSAGVCVDNRGRVYLGVNNSKSIYVLNAETGKLAKGYKLRAESRKLRAKSREPRAESRELTVKSSKS